MHFGGHVKRGCEVLIQDVRGREKKRKNQGFLPEHLVTIYPRDGEDRTEGCGGVVGGDEELHLGHGELEVLSHWGIRT